MPQLVSASTTTITRVPASATNITLLAANRSRVGACVYNNSAALLYVKLGATASLTSFTMVLGNNSGGTGGYFEVPDEYLGQIDGFWASATGDCMVSELT